MLCVGVFLFTDSRVRVGDRSVVCLVCYSPQNWDRNCVEDLPFADLGVLFKYMDGLLYTLGGAHWKHIFPSIILRSATLH